MFPINPVVYFGKPKSFWFSFPYYPSLPRWFSGRFNSLIVGVRCGLVAYFLFRTSFFLSAPQGRRQRSPLPVHSHPGLLRTFLAYLLLPRLGSFTAPHLPFSTRTGASSLSIRARHTCFWEPTPSLAIPFDPAFFWEAIPFGLVWSLVTVRYGHHDTNSVVLGP